MYLVLVLQSISLTYCSYTGITELMLVLRILFLYFRSYSWITEHILVLRNLYLHYRANFCISDSEVLVGTTEHFAGTKVPVGTTEQIHYTEVPRRYYRTYTYSYISDLILALRNMYLSYRSCTCFTNTGVPVGTIGLILIRISRRSFRVSSYAELILITDVCSFGTPVGVTELILIQNLYLFLYFGYGSTRRYYRTFYLYKSTHRYFRTYTYTEVPVGTIELLLIQRYP